MSRVFFGSVIWSIGQRYLPSLIQIITMLVITRMISPRDFGEVAIVTTLTQIAMLFVSSGLSEGLIFKVDCTQLKYTSVFYFNVGIALLFYLLFFFLSEWLAEIYSIERLSMLTKIVSLNLVLYSISYIQRTIYQKNMLFKKLMLISLCSTVIACVFGLLLAYSGAGVWAIVLLTLLINVFESIALWIFSTWRPLLKFSIYEVYDILPYSLKLMLNNLIQVSFDNIYSLIVGKYLGSQNLGYFNRMQTVVYYTTTNFMYSIESVFFPKLCKDKDSETTLIGAYERLLRISVMLSSLILLILIILPRQIVCFILTESWIEGAPILKLLSIAFLFVPITYINNSFLKIRNQPSVLLYSNVIKKIIGFILLFLTLSTKNIDFICYGLIVYYIFDALISMACVHSRVGISFFKQIYYLANSFSLIFVGYILGSYIINLFENNLICIISGVVTLILLFVVYNILFRTKEYLIIKSIVLKR